MAISLFATVKKYVGKLLKSRVLGILSRATGKTIRTAGMIKQMMKNFQVSRLSDWIFLERNLNAVLNGSLTVDSYILQSWNNELELRHTVIKIKRLFGIEPSEMNGNRVNYNFIKMVAIGRKEIAQLFEGGFGVRVELQPFQHRYFVRYGGRNQPDQIIKSLATAVESFINYLVKLGLEKV